LLRVSKRCDAAAHIGGLASGVLFGLIVALLIKIERRISVVTVTTLSVIFLISKKLQNVYLSNYRIPRRMQDFVEMEKMALESLILLWRQQGKINSLLLLRPRYLLLGRKYNFIRKTG
jgi:hypothetical protein